MDLLAIRGKTVSAVICQLQWREFGRTFKIECRDQFSIFVFGIRIDQSIGVQLTKETEGRTQVHGKIEINPFYSLSKLGCHGNVDVDVHFTTTLKCSQTIWKFPFPVVPTVLAVGFWLFSFFQYSFSIKTLFQI